MKKTNQGCPNHRYCSKDESKCCYLLSNHKCYLDTNDSEAFI